ncbi:MAG: hypothetical protein AAB907_03605 [Patescibacteria group bacterium]
MQAYSPLVIKKVQDLRKTGKTYREITQLLNLRVAKSTLSEWSKRVILPKDYLQKISKLNKNNLKKARIIALNSNRIKREHFLNSLDQINLPLSSMVDNIFIAKIALAMLCIGEASKSGSRTSFYLGNSDPRIVILFLALLKKCFDFKSEKVRCTVQCRADQNTEELERFWSEIVKIPRKQFYKSRIDPRTVGKPTKKIHYKGVLRVEYFDTKVRLELESLANLVYNHLLQKY